MIFNVRVAVVELVEASTPAEAILELCRRLDVKGFVPLDGDEHQDAFESEDP